jgi:hypothetical protein
MFSLQVFCCIASFATSYGHFAVLQHAIDPALQEPIRGKVLAELKSKTFKTKPRELDLNILYQGGVNIRVIVTEISNGCLTLFRFDQPANSTLTKTIKVGLMQYLKGGKLQYELLDSIARQSFQEKYAYTPADVHVGDILELQVVYCEVKKQYFATHISIEMRPGASVPASRLAGTVGRASPHHIKQDLCNRLALGDEIERDVLEKNGLRGVARSLYDEGRKYPLLEDDLAKFPEPVFKLYKEVKERNESLKAKALQEEKKKP